MPSRKNIRNRFAAAASQEIGNKIGKTLNVQKTGKCLIGKNWEIDLRRPQVGKKRRIHKY